MNTSNTQPRKYPPCRICGNNSGTCKGHSYMPVLCNERYPYAPDFMEHHCQLSDGHEGKHNAGMGVTWED